MTRKLFDGISPSSGLDPRIIDVVFFVGAVIAMLGAVAIVPVTARRRADLATQGIKVMR